MLLSNNYVMSNKLFITIVLILIILFAACKKDNENPKPPQISFKVGDTYTKDNAVVSIGHKLLFGVTAAAGDEVITNFTIKKILENGESVNMMDTGVYTSTLDLTKIFYQNVEDKATWIFSVMDRNRLSSEIKMVVYKDPNSAFGGIHYYPSIKMGYQNNSQYGHFLDLSTGKVWFEDSASLFYNQIDVLCYYIISESLPSPVLSSAGEMDNYSTDAQTFYPSIVGWPSRNYTKWDISVDTNPLSVSDFNNAHNDSLLIVSYHDVWGKKKFRWATAGRIIPFLTSGGKYGLIRVIHADFFDNGIMEIAVKVQQ